PIPADRRKASAIGTKRQLVRRGAMPLEGGEPLSRRNVPELQVCQAAGGEPPTVQAEGQAVGIFFAFDGEDGLPIRNVPDLYLPWLPGYQSDQPAVGAERYAPDLAGMVAKGEASLPG